MRCEGSRVSSDSVEDRCRFWRALGQGCDQGHPDSRTLSAGGLQGFHFFSVCRRARLCRSHRIIRIVLPAVHADRPKWADGPRSSRYVYLYGNSECVVVSPGGERRNGGGTDAGNWYSAAADELRRIEYVWGIFYAVASEKHVSPRGCEFRRPENGPDSDRLNGTGCYRRV